MTVTNMCWAVAAVEVLHIVGIIQVLLHLAGGRVVKRGNQARDPNRSGYVQGGFLRRTIRVHLFRLRQSVLVGGSRHLGSDPPEKSLPFTYNIRLFHVSASFWYWGQDFSRCVLQGSKDCKHKSERCIAGYRVIYVCFVTSISASPSLSADSRTQLNR